MGGIIEAAIDYYSRHKDIINIHYKNDKAFYMSAGYGRLDVAMWLYSLDPKNTNIHANDDYAFRTSAGNGYIDMAKWLYSLDPKNTNIHANDDNAFRMVCQINNLEMAQWLYSLDPGNFNFNKIFKYRGDWYLTNPRQTKLTKWLLQIGVVPNICSLYNQIQHSREKYHAFLHNQTYSNTYASSIIRNIVQRYL